jgi:hypothetical protein
MQDPLNAYNILIKLRPENQIKINEFTENNRNGDNMEIIVQSLGFVPDNIFTKSFIKNMPEFLEPLPQLQRAVNLEAVNEFAVLHAVEKVNWSPFILAPAEIVEFAVFQTEVGPVGLKGLLAISADLCSQFNIKSLRSMDFVELELFLNENAVDIMKIARILYFYFSG